MNLTDQKQAKKVMGVRADAQSRVDELFVPSVSSHLKTFSEDVLMLEVMGPDKGHFSIIDVPGIFRVPTEGRTTKADIEIVNRIVQGYVSNPRSIILAVVPANVDLATEEILNIAAEHDPDGSRTIGVLTKPDLVDRGAEQGVMSVLEDRQHKLRHGWCIVRNLGQSESQMHADREKVEQEFFEKRVPWKAIPKRKVGITSLCERLQRILQAHTEKEFPAVSFLKGVRKLKYAEQHRSKPSLKSC